jgi:hypothetical protein
VAGDVLVQVHIPKCAGTSISAWLRNASASGYLAGFGAFYPDFVFSDEGLWKSGLHDPRLTAISAHSVRRFPPQIHGRPMHYFTILRRPLPHALSIIRYMIQERRAYGIPLSVGDSSREIAAWLLSRTPGAFGRENLQTNHLALYPWADATKGRCDPDESEHWSAADRAAYERERLDIAKDVLRSFLAVGTVERLTESLELLRARSAQHGIHLAPADRVPRDNVTQIPIDDIAWIESEPLGRRLLDSMAVDAELYAFAEELLAATLAGQRDRNERIGTEGAGRIDPPLGRDRATELAVADGDGGRIAARLRHQIDAGVRRIGADDDGLIAGY